MTKTYKMEVDCANCANLMEAATCKVPGVAAASVNFMTQKITVTFTADSDPSEVMPRVLQACKKIEDDCEIFL